MHSYLHPRVFRLKEEKPIRKNKAVIKILVMNSCPSSLLVVPRTAEVRGVRVRNDDSVAELLLATEHRKENKWQQNPHTNVNEE